MNAQIILEIAYSSEEKISMIRRAPNTVPDMSMAACAGILTNLFVFFISQIPEADQAEAEILLMAEFFKLMESRNENVDYLGADEVDLK